MDVENLFILLIIFSFIARVIGDALKGGKKGQDRQQRPGGPRRPPQQQVPQQQRRPLPQPQGEWRESAPRELQPVPQRRPEAESAADLVPAELWEMLTGQKRPPVAVPVPQRVPDEADDDEELIPDEESLIPVERSNEDRDIEELLRKRREAVERRERGPAPYRPQVVSLETPPLPTAARHAAFHEKYDAQPPPRVSRPATQSGLAKLAGSETGALRRAIILQEVLGPPKGLE